MAKEKMPVETSWILDNLSVELLEDLINLSNSKQFPAFLDFCRRFVETKRNQTIDLNYQDRERLANEFWFRKGQIYSVGVITTVLKFASKEFSKRKEK